MSSGANVGGRDDASLLQPSVDTGLKGVALISDAYSKGTPEVTRLLREECDVVIECRCCRNLFRSLVNFVTHKRTYCRGAFRAFEEHLNTQGLQQQAAPEMCAEEESRPSSNHSASSPTSDQADDPAKVSDQPTRRSILDNTHLKVHSSPTQEKNRLGALRRANPTSTLYNKRMEVTESEADAEGRQLVMHTLPRVSKMAPSTRFENGVQVVVSDVEGRLAEKERDEGNSDSVVMVVPQDLTARYSLMTLRNRQMNASAAAQTLNNNEVPIVERLTAYSVDVAEKTCQEGQCDNKEFFTISFLAYHVALWHARAITAPSAETLINVADTTDGKQPSESSSDLRQQDTVVCLLCGKELSEGARDLGLLSLHLVETHGDVYDAYKAHTAALAAKTRNSIRRRKPGRQPSQRCGSLSPPPSPIFNRTAVSSDEHEPTSQSTASADTKEEEITPAVEADAGDDDDLTSEAGSEEIGSGGGVEDVSVPKTEEVSKTAEDEDETKKSKVVTDSACTSRRAKIYVNAIGDALAKTTAEKAATEGLGSTKKGTRSRSATPAVTSVVCKSAAASDTYSASSAEKANLLTASMNGKRKRVRRSTIGLVRRKQAAVAVIAKRQRKRRLSVTTALRADADASETKSKSVTTTPVASELTPSARSSNRKRAPASWLNDENFLVGKAALRHKPENESKDCEEKLAKSPKKPTVPRVRPAKSRSEKFRNGLKSSPPGGASGVARSTSVATPPMADGPSKTGHVLKMPASPGNRRKQDLSPYKGEALRLRRESTKPDDLSEVPVRMTDHQRQVFHSALEPEDVPKSQRFRCTVCQKIYPDIHEGRHHAVAHLNLVRFYCVFCKAGAFFCSDMRRHLKGRYCEHMDEKYRSADAPTMGSEEADSLTMLASDEYPQITVSFWKNQVMSYEFPKPRTPERVYNKPVGGDGDSVKNVKKPRAINVDIRSMSSQKYGAPAVDAAADVVAKVPTKRRRLNVKVIVEKASSTPPTPTTTAETPLTSAEHE